MPARDLYHDAVKHALNKDGWAITHDPLRLRWGTKRCLCGFGRRAASCCGEVWAENRD